MAARIWSTHTLRQAETHFHAGSRQLALPLLMKILKNQPYHPQANSILGLLHLQVGRTTQAIKCFQNAANAQPTVAIYWLRLLAACKVSGNEVRARTVLEQAAQHHWPPHILEQLAKLASQPSCQRKESLLAIFHAKKDQLTCEIAARLFIDDYPEHPLGWQVLGALLHEAGKLEGALEIAQAMVERFPADANAYSNLSYVLLALNYFEDALKSARAALRLSPELIQAQKHEQRALEGVMRSRGLV